MAASVRAHANLNLFLAERALSGMSEGAFDAFWGEHSDLLAMDTAIFRLQVAYRCHLADLCEQKQLALRPRTAAEASDLIAAHKEFVPEILELAEREQRQDWLSDLLNEDFLPSSPQAQSGGGIDVIARSEGRSLRNRQSLETIVAELKELFVRHRDTQQEY